MNKAASSQSIEITSTSLGDKKPLRQFQHLDPNKRYLSVKIVALKAMVDFINPRDDEYLTVTISFLKSRFHSKAVPASTDPVFDECFLFEVQGENENARFDASMMLKLKQPLHITILKHRGSERAQVIGSKNLEWRHLLACNSIESNAEMLPVDLTHQGSLGVIQLHMDLVPALGKNELIHDQTLQNQLTLERKYE
mmetsp:Transcript_28845/g.21483  ORF Transcript_28845/g.21483 Transcript_28845/m.21483 type:complete len:196 (-) Transcript_28845:1115-1702(-)|eukprot:CAMPEP_0202963502 /NCGR_PEP_ID=MMETSP1396-20130829/7494_1 /ASSEMBLY_ACC=CAM_ASM_000872 /TAXON_ID= /ORGANISM="Pseudokeronopsis sp., Strain Brazil" /LENGTH=195 /DNA_ID=CAMNT_0049684771 /DNA_START=94 /DNA_END=681 /DNA_ORIENTATION=-